MILALFWALPLAAAQKIALEGEMYQFDQDTNTLLYKNPRAIFEGGEISAQQLSYQKNDGLLSFEGNVVLRARDFMVTASSAKYDLKTKRFHAESVGLYDYVNQTYLSAKELTQTETNRFEIIETTLTLCHPDDPAWEFYSSFMDYQIDNFAYSINTVLTFYKVPIFYTPGIAWPTRRGRSSGFLAPLFLSKNGDPDKTKNWGSRAQLPYFWAIGPEQDLTVTTDWVQKRGTGTEFLYRWAFLPGMTGSFDLWQISETNSRDLNEEDLGALKADQTANKAQRFRYDINHRQNLGGGQLFFHQDQRSDNEVEKEYDSLRIGQQYSFNRNLSWVFPWSGGGLSIGHERSQSFLYPSVFDKATDHQDHLNRDAFAEVNQQFDQLFGSNVGLSTQAMTSNYRREFGWNGNLSQVVLNAQAPFHLDFLNIIPAWKRTSTQYNTQYTPKVAEAEVSSFVPRPATFGWNLDQTTVEANFEVFRVFSSRSGSKSRLGLRPKVIYDQVQDVDQRQGLNFTPANHQLTEASSDTGPSADYARLGNRFIAPIYSYKTLSYRFETRYLTKKTAKDSAQSAVTFDIEQTYNLGRKKTAAETWTSYVGPQVPEVYQETSLGNQKMPLKLYLGLSPHELYQVNLFYRFDHELGRMIENQVSFSASSPIQDTLQLTYTDNSKAYMDLKGNMHGQAKSYSLEQNVKFGLRNRLKLTAIWDLSRNDPANLYSTGVVNQRLDRQLTKAGASLILGHQCFDYEIGYLEEIIGLNRDGVMKEGLDRRVSLSMILAKWPADNTPYKQTIGL